MRENCILEDPSPSIVGNLTLFNMLIPFVFFLKDAFQTSIWKGDNDLPHLEHLVEIGIDLAMCLAYWKRSDKQVQDTTIPSWPEG